MRSVRDEQSVLTGETCNKGGRKRRSMFSRCAAYMQPEPLSCRRRERPGRSDAGAQDVGWRRARSDELGRTLLLEALELLKERRNVNDHTGSNEGGALGVHQTWNEKERAGMIVSLAASSTDGSHELARPWRLKMPSQRVLQGRETLAEGGKGLLRVTRPVSKWVRARVELVLVMTRFCRAGTAASSSPRSISALMCAPSPSLPHLTPKTSQI